MSINNSGQIHHAGSQQTEAHKMLEEFWPKEILSIQNMSNNDFRNPELPLARIKKIMKLDEDVKMISGEAPVLFAKAVEIFIAELSLRAWVNTEDNKRRTLQRNDIAMGITKYDQFDFLIDIVPREEISKQQNAAKKPEAGVPIVGNVISQDQLNYFLLAQQQQQLQAAAAVAAGQPIQIIQAAPGQGQSFSISPQVFQLPVQSAPGGTGQDVTSGSTPTVIATGPQVVQLASADGSQAAANGGDPKQATGAAAAAATASGPIILSNSLQYGASGEMVAQPMPISLTSQQLQALLNAQGASQTGSGPIIINPLPQFITTNHAGQMVQAITIPTTTQGNLEQQQPPQQQTSTSSSSNKSDRRGAQS